jgi:hypothetical protein
MTRTLSLLAALLLGSAAPAHDFTHGDLQIVHPAIPLPFAGARSAAGYLSVTNTGAMADRLTGAAAGFADAAMLHRSQTDPQGVSSMTHVAALEIPAGQTVTLAPGGHHVMFLGLTQRLAEGDLLPVTLTFERAGPVEVEFMVDPPRAGGHGH